VLTAKGCDVAYSEYAGGHDYVCWRSSLAEGLLELART
jgi:enterochelin esterase family protein